LKEFFAPAMTNQPASPQSALAGVAGAASAAQNIGATTADTSKGTAGNQGQVQIGFQLQYKKQEELREADYDYSVVAPETRTHPPNVLFTALLAGSDQAQHIRQVDLDDPFFRTLGVTVSSIADWGAIDLKKVALDVAYGGTEAAPDKTATLLFGPG